MWLLRRARVPLPRGARIVAVCAQRPASVGGSDPGTPAPSKGTDRTPLRSTWFALPVAVLGLGLGGCKPAIGAGCTLSTDCSSQGDRVCDTAQSGGYCTVLNCSDNSCPDNAACILFQVSVPGCLYNDYSAPARTGSSMCMKTCTQDSDCRESDGYVCENPRNAPWYAAILDDNQGESVCIAAPSSSALAMPPPSNTGVCAASLPPLPEADAGGGDASPPDAEAPDSAIEGGLGPEAGADAAADGATDAGAEAGVDATLGGDAEIESGAPDGASDASGAADVQGDED